MKILEDIKAKYFITEIGDLKPRWYDTWKSIEAANIPGWKKPEQEYDHLIIGLKIERITDHISPDLERWFKKIPVQFSSESQKRVRSIIEAFESQIPILPPTICIDEKSKIQITDGKHRFIVAYSLGADTVPMIMPGMYLGSDNVMKRLRTLGDIHFCKG